MKILSIPASNSGTSINRQLLTYAKAIIEESSPEVEVEMVDINDYELAIYSPEREEAGGIPDKAKELFDKIGAADAIMMSFAEHNGSYTAAWKNTYDWASRVDQQVYQQRPVLMLAASPGPRGGAGVLGAATMSAPFFGAELVGSLGVGTFYEAFDEKLVDQEADAELRALVEALVTAATAAPAS